MYDDQLEFQFSFEPLGMIINKIMLDVAAKRAVYVAEQRAQIKRQQRRRPRAPRSTPLTLPGIWQTRHVASRRAR